MTFTVTYRDKDGTTREERVEAANRAECFSKCRAKGILPLSMEESRSNGKTRRSNRETRRSKGDAMRSNRKTRRSILAAVLVVAALAGVGFWLWTTRSKVAMQVVKVDRPKKSTALAKEVKPAKAPKPVPEAPKPKPVATNEAPKVPVRKMTVEERAAMIEKKIRETPIDLSTRTNRAFRTGLEQTLAAIFTTPLGAPPPPLPLKLTPVTYIHLQSILDAPNEILETDSERVVEAKMAVTTAKKMLKEHIAAGGDPEKFLESYYSHLKQASDEWRAAQFKLVETMKNDPGLAPSLEAEYNENFAARGIRPVKMPPKLKERYGIK